MAANAFLYNKYNHPNHSCRKPGVLRVTVPGVNPAIWLKIGNSGVNLTISIKIENFGINST